MGHTSRATYPRAIVKDRSLSKNGNDKSAPKSHAPGNRGIIDDEIDAEFADDYEDEVDEGTPEVQDPSDVKEGVIASENDVLPSAKDDSAPADQANVDVVTKNPAETST